MARQLRRDVQRLASELGRQQRPAYYDEVSGEFFFEYLRKWKGRRWRGKMKLTILVSKREWIGIG